MNTTESIFTNIDFLETESVVSLNETGLRLAKSGEMQKAEENFLKAISLNDRYVEAYCNLGTLHLSEGKKDKAEEMFEEAYKYNPGLVAQHSIGTF